MSDYKILHKRETGRDSWEVFYKGKPLMWLSPKVEDILGGLAKNPFRTLSDAKKIIECHKDHTDWLEKVKQGDVVEWLDEEGNPLEQPTEKVSLIITPDPVKTGREVALVAGVVVVLFIILTLILAVNW